MRVGVDREQAADLGRHPQQRVGRVLALGAAVDLDRDAVVAAGGEDTLRVELRLGRPRPVMSRPVQCPSTSTCGLDTAATMRSVIWAPGIRSWE